MRRAGLVVQFALALTVGVLGCGKSSKSAAACGAGGQVCCAANACDADLACQAGTCQTGTVACGAKDQACCATGKACAGNLACSAGTCATPVPSTATKSICATGGTLQVAGATLTIPSGALAFCTLVKLSLSADPAPDGYTAYSPVVQVDPASTQLAKPATLSLDVAGSPALSAMYWSQQGTAFFEPVAGTLETGTMTAQVSHFGEGFVAGRDYVLTCAAGGTLAVPGATLTIPPDALTSCAMVKLSSTAAPPVGYTPYSPVIQVEPAALALAKPVSLAVDFAGDAGLATLFWSRQGTTGFERAAAGASNGTMTGTVSHLGSGFVADGLNFVDPADRSCVISKLVEGRTVTPSTIALFFTVDDCWGRPLSGLTGADFSVQENKSPISPAESSATILPRNGVEIFASLVIDLSASTLPYLPSVVTSAKNFVNDLQVTKGLPVQIDIQLFAGDQALTQWQAPTLDTATLLAKLDALAGYNPTDRSSTNLNGAVVAALTRVSQAEGAFRTRNYGGAFTIGYLVVFTDGKDTAGRVDQAAAVTAVKASPDQVIAVGLQSTEYDGVALSALAPGGVITATDTTQLSTAFLALANKMEEQINRRFYLLGYCSPKRAGTTNTVSVGVVGSTNQSSASYEFDATGFAPGCSATTFTTGCDGKQCGGLGCGACYDRLASCDEASSLCVDNCLAQGLCAGGAITNSLGYDQSCVAKPTNFSCGGACVDTTTDASNCGGCGNVCGGAQRCAAGLCVN
jgi:hypothetical protein